MVPDGHRVRGVAAARDGRTVIWNDKAIWLTTRSAPFRSVPCDLGEHSIASVFLPETGYSIAVALRSSAAVLAADQDGICSTWFRVPPSRAHPVGWGRSMDRLALVEVNDKRVVSLRVIDTLGRPLWKRDLGSVPALPDAENWHYVSVVDDGIIVGSETWPMSWRLIGNDGQLAFVSAGPDSSSMALLGFTPGEIELHGAPVVQSGTHFLQSLVNLERQTRVLVTYDLEGTFLRVASAPRLTTLVATVPGSAEVIGLRRTSPATIVTLSRSQ